MIQEDLVELKTIKIRGTANPYVGLEQSISLVDQLKKAVGKGPFSKDVAAQGLNHQSASGPALGKIAALVHFGLLKRDGNAYSITNLADRILLPVSDEDKIIAIIEAAKKPKLYRQLIEKYQNQALPLMLNNIIVRDYGINEKRSNEVTKNFRKSLEFAGILDKGVLVLKSQSESSIGDNKEITQSQISKISNSINTPSEFTELPSGIKIIFPDSLKFNVVLGDFSEFIKGINDKAIQILEAKNKETLN